MYVFLNFVKVVNSYICTFKSSVTVSVSAFIAVTVAFLLHLAGADRLIWHAALR